MSQIREVKFFITEGQRDYFSEWYESLKDRRARLLVANKLRQLQNPSFTNYTSVGGGVFELRLFLGPAYRIYFGIENESLVIVLLAGDKSTQVRDIKKAIKLWRKYLNA